mmetsp:Transcript_41688/g.99944  ORF Transcript_41688/g.99944 Transcript_41688/m.99944 type:complete len:393 (-) Transcript_41688:288-1466(-)
MKIVVQDLRAHAPENQTGHGGDEGGVVVFGLQAQGSESWGDLRLILGVSNPPQQPSQLFPHLGGAPVALTVVDETNTAVRAEEDVAGVGITVVQAPEEDLKAVHLEQVLEQLLRAPQQVLHIIRRRPLDPPPHRPQCPEQRQEGVAGHDPPDPPRQRPALARGRAVPGLGGRGGQAAGVLGGARGHGAVLRLGGLYLGLDPIPHPLGEVHPQTPQVGLHHVLELLPRNVGHGDDLRGAHLRDQAWNHDLISEPRVDSVPHLRKIAGLPGIVELGLELIPDPVPEGQSILSNEPQEGADAAEVHVEQQLRSGVLDLDHHRLRRAIFHFHHGLVGLADGSSAAGLLLHAHEPLRPLPQLRPQRPPDIQSVRGRHGILALGELLPVLRGEELGAD